MRRFLALWAVGLVVLLAVVGGFNAIVNPYETFAWARIPGINEFKPGTRTHVAQAKAYQVERARPATVIIGTSRAYLGMDAAAPMWPESYRPVYNYGTPGSIMSDVIFRELREAWGTGRLRHAVAILDLPSFLSPDPDLTRGPNERRLLFLDNGKPNPDRTEQRLSDAFLSVFTLGALVDSVKTVLARNGGDTVLDLRPDGTATEADFLDVARAEGMNALFTQKDEYDLARVGGFRRTLSDWHGPMPNVAILRDMIRFCLEHNVTLTLVLGPSHVDQLEIYRQAGLWRYVEQLKVDIAHLVAEANSDSITAWDFLEYAPYTTEHVPPGGDKTTRMRWFWESVHFQRPLGDLMMQRIFSGTPADFGVKLTEANVEARNSQVRQQQRGFIGWHLACESNRQTPCEPLPQGAPTEASR